MQASMYCEAEWKDGFILSLKQMGQTVLQIAASWIFLYLCKMEVRCKENILGCSLMIQASFLFSHLNTAVLENRASVNKGKLSVRSSLHISPEATGSFQCGMPSEGISTEVDQHKNIITMKTIRSLGLKAGKIMDFHAYRNLLLLFGNFQTYLLSNFKNALINALFIV